jgi:hypothetical protein
MAQGCSDCDAANETGNLLGESEGVASTSQGGGQLPVAEYFGGGFRALSARRQTIFDNTA